MRRALALAPLFAAATLLIASPGAADQEELRPIDLRLEYGFGEGVKPCMDEMGFRTYLVTNTEHYDPFDPGQAKHIRSAVDWRMVRVKIVRSGRGFSGTVKAFDAEGVEVWSKQVYTTPRCVDVVDGLAFILALGLDVSLVPPPPPEPAPAPPPPALPPPSAPSSPPAPAAPRPVVLPAPARPESFRPPLLLGLGSFVALGRTPSFAAPGLLVSAALRWPWFSVAMDGRALLPVLPMEVEGPAGQVARVRFSVVTASAGPCFHSGAFFFCVPFEVGVYDFSSTANMAIFVEDPVIASFGLRAGAEVGFAKRFAIRGYADATMMPTLASLQIDGRTMWRQSVLSGVVSVAFSVRFDANP